jgi:hypothetical protein
VAALAHPRGNRQYGSLGYDGYYHWDLLDGPYTLAVLFEYAGTLGLLDLDFQNNWGGDGLEALGRYDGLQSIRLNALGGYALGLTDIYTPVAVDAEEARPLKVLPNLDIVATGVLSPADQLVLSAYAEQVGSTRVAISRSSPPSWPGAANTNCRTR